MAPDRIMDEARELRQRVLWESNSSIEQIARVILAAEQRGMEMAAQTCNGISAGFTAMSQAPGKSEDETKLLQVVSEAFAEGANLIRSRKEG